MSLSPRRVPIDRTPLGEREQLRVVSAYWLKGCLAVQATSTQSEVVLLSDRSRIILTNGRPQKTQWGDYWDPDAPINPPAPRLNSGSATSTARVGYRTVTGKRIEGWVGTWPTQHGSAIAFFTRDGQTLGKPKVLFFVKMNIADIRIGTGSVDGPALTLSFLADDPVSGKIAASLYWRVNNVLYE